MQIALQTLHIKDRFRQQVDLYHPHVDLGNLSPIPVIDKITLSDLGLEKQTNKIYFLPNSHKPSQA